MLPTFNMIGDIVVLEHFSHKLKRLEIGDVVVCISPTNPWRAVCKRILGMVNLLKKEYYLIFFS
jgi:inner membrane protease subunit 1